MTDRLWGIADLFLDGDLDAPTVHDTSNVYFWCRRHGQAHKVGEKCEVGCTCEPPAVFAGGKHFSECATQQACIDIGPFMTEREALRLNVHWRTQAPLGMAVES